MHEGLFQLLSKLGNALVAIQHSKIASIDWLCQQVLTELKSELVSVPKPL